MVTIVTIMITNKRLDKKAVNLFGKVRQAILSLLFGHTDQTFYLRQIVRTTGFGLGPVQRELKQLTESGTISRTVLGRQVFFRANPESPIFSELKSLILKTAGIGDTLRAALAPIAGQLKAALIFGSMSKGRESYRSDIDLMIIGDVSFADVVANLQAAQKSLGREINPTVYPPEEFKAKMRANHHFLTSVLNGPKIFLIGDEDGLRRLAAKRMAR